MVGVTIGGTSPSSSIGRYLEDQLLNNTSATHVAVDEGETSSAVKYERGLPSSEFRSIDTIAVAGGSGTIGSEILAVLDEEGYRTVNLDRHPTDDQRADEFVRGRLLDAGRQRARLASGTRTRRSTWGTITSPNHDPGHVTFESNAMSTYTALEAAEQVGLEAVCLASSVNAHGWTFQDELPTIDYLPIDEEYRVSSRDRYGLGKRVMEVTADGFGRRSGVPRTIVTLRYFGACGDEHLAHLTGRYLTMADLRERYEPDDNPG